MSVTKQNSVQKANWKYKHKFTANLWRECQRLKTIFCDSRLWDLPGMQEWAGDRTLKEVSKVESQHFCLCSPKWKSSKSRHRDKPCSLNQCERITTYGPQKRGFNWSRMWANTTYLEMDNCSWKTRLLHFFNCQALKKMTLLLIWSKSNLKVNLTLE